MPNKDQAEKSNAPRKRYVRHQDDAGHDGSSQADRDLPGAADDDGVAKAVAASAGQHIVGSAFAAGVDRQLDTPVGE